MKLLLHTCCAPCLIFPLNFLNKKHIETTAFFYNPNIHPFVEFKKRVECLVAFTDKYNVSLIADKNYGLIDFTRSVVFNEKKRCSLCYDLRLNRTAIFAKENGYTSFSTTLLYSKYQNHQLIVEKCQKLSNLYNLDFVYHDFREGWQSGIDRSIAENLYRQPYCGCIYSEQDRYDNKLKKQLKKQRKRVL